MASNTKIHKAKRGARDKKKLAARRKKEAKRRQKAIETGLTIDI